MIDAVEERQDQRIRPNRRGEVVDGRLKSMGFNAQENEVVGDGKFVSGHD
jgi:hypothetical protein